MKKQWMIVSAVSVLVAPLSVALAANPSAHTGQQTFHETMQMPNAIACSMSAHMKSRSSVGNDSTNEVSVRSSGGSGKSAK